MGVTTTKPTDQMDTDIRANRAIPDNVRLLDIDWAKGNFMAPGKALSAAGRNIRYFTTAYFKTEDTSLGGSLAINARAQANMYCDPRPRRLADNGRIIRANYLGGTAGGDIGMGEYYSSVIHDNAELLYLTAGVPAFNSTVSIIANAIDYDESILANTGRTSTMYDIGNVIGGATMLYAFPLMSLLAYSIKGLSILLESDRTFDYYYIKETMPTYWGMVNTIATQLTTELGLLIPSFTDTDKEIADDIIKGKIGRNMKLSIENIDRIKELMPNLFTSSNTVDVFAVAVKPQAIRNAVDNYIADMSDNYTTTGSLIGALLGSRKAGEAFEGKVNSALSFSNYKGQGGISAFENYVGNSTNIHGNWNTGGLTYATTNKVFSTNHPKSNVTETPQPVTDSATTTESDTASLTKEKIKNDERYGPTRNPDGSYTLNNSTPVMNYTSSKFDVFRNAADSFIRDGAHHAIFSVNYSGTGSDSFSNSFGSIDTGSTVNAYGSQARDLYFDMSGGNIVGGMDTVIQGVTDLLAGALNGVTFGMSNILAALSGGGRLTIPDKWTDSSADLADYSYTMDLIGTANDIVTSTSEIWIPLAMVLPFVLPQATGKSSYTSPLLCTIYNKGKEEKKLAMMSSLTIERGVTNLPFDSRRRTLALKVTMRFKDLSPIMSVPVPTGIFSQILSSFDDTSPFAAYIRTLAARDLRTSKYFIPKMKLKISRGLAAVDSALSPAAWGMRLGDKVPNVVGGIVSYSSLSLNSNN